MKSRFIIAFLCIMVLTSCLPEETTTEDRKPVTPTATDTKTSTATQTETPTTETPAPTTTPDLTFNLIEDSMVNQPGNTLPALILQNAPSHELADNHIGIWWENYARYQDSSLIFSNGFTRMRIGSLMDWSGDDQEWPLNKDTLLPRVDDIITEYAEGGIKIALIIQEGTDVPFIVQEFTQEDIDKLLGVTAFIVEHFKGRIAYYEIYNEFGNTSKVHTYASLVEQSAALIKEIDTDAKVIFGSVPGDTLEGQEGYGEHYRFRMNTDYMWALINAVDFSQIDGFSWHPIYDPIPEDPLYQNYPQLVEEIKARLAAKGFDGEYFADELLWHTWDEPGYRNGPPVSKTIAAKYFLRTITEHRGLDVNVTINTFFQEPEMEAIRNLNNVLAGAEPTDGLEVTLDTSEEVPYLRKYTFTLPNGDALLAVWRNGPATEDDIGILSTLTIADVSASSVTGINVFDGFEQELNFETEDNNLLIHDLSLKDFPIFIKIVGDLP